MRPPSPALYFAAYQGTRDPHVIVGTRGTFPSTTRKVPILSLAFRRPTNLFMGHNVFLHTREQRRQILVHTLLMQAHLSPIYFAW